MLGLWLVKHTSPHARLRLAGTVFDLSLILWPATHILMVTTNPEENTWVFHVLIAISYLAITWTAFDILQTSDVRKEQSDAG